MDSELQRVIQPPLPQQPEHPSPQPPMVYVKESLVWEYQVLARDLAKEEAPTQAELNELGQAGWELTGILAASSQAYFYFKRLAE
jgi:hypothetical protein